MNAGGVLQTCKSNGKGLRTEYSGARVSNVWVTYPSAGDNQGKLWLIPNSPVE
jgi:hypothetical protein